VTERHQNCPGIGVVEIAPKKAGVMVASVMGFMESCGMFACQGGRLGLRKVHDYCIGA